MEYRPSGDKAPRSFGKDGRMPKGDAERRGPSTKDDDGGGEGNRNGGSGVATDAVASLSTEGNPATSRRIVVSNPYEKKKKKKEEEEQKETTVVEDGPARGEGDRFERKRSHRSIAPPWNPPSGRRRLQCGLVLHGDETEPSCPPFRSNGVGGSSSSSGSRTLHDLDEDDGTGVAALYHDPDFRPLPESIEGVHAAERTAVKCRCSPAQPAVLAYSKGSRKKNRNKDRTDRPKQTSSSSSSPVALVNVDRPYYRCRSNPTECRFFKWAYAPHLLHWYRFGSHNRHSLVRPRLGGSYSAEDLVQGTVGDCWFLSALAVVAERPDLIRRLFPDGRGGAEEEELDRRGMVRVELFVDGWWKTVTMDNFLPCSVEYGAMDGRRVRERRKIAADEKEEQERSSEHDPHAIADASRDIIRETKQYLLQDRGKKVPFGTTGDASVEPIRPLEIGSADLAYSKARGNQLWVPFVEKAYAKIHGSYQAISGGHIAEAFLDLTGAPTLTYAFDSPSFAPRPFWSSLLSYRRKRLPMGCGTSTSQVGIVGGHAYSILDVREVTGVGVGFFTERLVDGTLGGASGFTEYDGVVRLLRVRNPHGEGEWKGRFSDGSAEWERLLNEVEGGVGGRGGRSGSAGGLERTMENDGTFWIDYDSFLMGFTDVDVVLAFRGNHAKSFRSNFPPKKSGHRCGRAFELAMLDEQPGLESVDSVEAYAMIVQKTKRGASRGRVDRKKSYKICDVGLFVAAASADGTVDYARPMEGRFLGMTRVGHHRIVLGRGEGTASKVVLPVSFGHPAATDKEMEFTVRFVSDAPLMIRELEEVPRIDRVVHKFCMEFTTRRVLWEGLPGYRVFLVDCTGRGSGGTVLFYLHVTDDDSKKLDGASFSIRAKCRGMVCRTEEGLVDHEKETGPTAPRRKFTAAWRSFQCSFVDETKSRLLMVLVQSGQDWEFNADGVCCSKVDRGHVLGGGGSGAMKKKGEDLRGYLQTTPSSMDPNEEYIKRGVFAPVVNEIEVKKHCLYIDGNGSTSMENAAAIPFLHDPELEKALAVSRNEIELRRVLEMSKGGNVSSRAMLEGEDLDLQRAIAMSNGGSTVANRQNMFGKDGDDVDLLKAIQLSVGGDPEKESCKKFNEDVIIDVDRCSPCIQKSRNNITCEVIEILDEDDDISDHDNGITPLMQGSEDVPEVGHSDCNIKSGDKAMEGKRKLALDAAIKRLSTM